MLPGDNAELVAVAAPRALAKFFTYLTLHPMSLPQISAFSLIALPECC